MPRIFGEETNHVIHKSESHKLHQQFDVDKHDTSTGGSDIQIGMPVKMAGDFTIAPFAAGDKVHELIGVAIHDTDLEGYREEKTPYNSIKDTYSLKRVTVSMRAYIIIEGVAGTGNVTAGPVKYAGYSATDDMFPHPGVNVFKDLANAGEADQCVGWALHAADDGEVVRVALAV